MGKAPGDLRTKEEREAARKEFGAAMRQAVMEYALHSQLVGAFATAIPTPPPDSLRPRSGNSVR